MVNRVQNWELINGWMIPYNPIIRSVALLHQHNDSEQPLRTLIKKEPDAYSFPGNTSGSLYIFVFQAIAHIFKLYGTRSLLQLYLHSAYPHLISNRIRSAVAWTKQHVPMFVDPITHICWVSICVTEQHVLCHRSVSNHIDFNSTGLGHIKTKKQSKLEARLLFVQYLIA